MGKLKMINFIILLSIFLTIYAKKDVVPAFIIDNDRIMEHLKYDANPFNKMSSTDFADIVHDTIKRSSRVIMFIEDTFCVEDISTRDKLGSPFSYLREGLLNKQVTYFPGVSNPFGILNQIFQPQPLNVFFLNVGMKLDLQDKFKYIYVFFQDGLNETRPEMLRRHDVIIKDVYFSVNEATEGSILAFYTGKYNPVVVEKLSFLPIEPISEPLDRSVFVRSNGAIFKFRDVHTVSVSRRSLFRQAPMVAEENWEYDRLSTRMSYTEFELQFNFEFQPDKWKLDSVALIEGGEEVGRTKLDVGVLWNWSYVCSEPLVIINTRDGSSVAISQYQIQPRSNGSDTYTNLTSFGKAVNCGPYFSSVILSVLLVTFVCLAILMYGVSTLFECVSNDRFDDPNAKPFYAAEGAQQ